MALTEATKKANWLKSSVNEMGLKQGLMEVKCGSQSVMSSEESGLSCKDETIDVRYHQIRDWLNSGEIEVEKVHMDENASDFLTKPVTAKKFK